MDTNILKLQNGSDIRGVALENEVYPISLTNDRVEMIAYGFIRFLEKRLNKPAHQLKIAIGNDSRLSRHDIKKCLVTVFSYYGVEVVDCHLASTPAMFMATIFETNKCDASIMITASHLPYYFNGLKFFINTGGLEKEDIKEILNNSLTYEYVPNLTSKVTSYDLIKEYSNYLVEYIKKETQLDLPLAGLKIIVDAGNGAGGFFVDILQMLGADTRGSQFIDPDGTFPNHIPNPEDKEAMASITKAVLENHSDLGIIFDTDVDRAGLVLNNGQEVNRNSLIALISNIVLEQYPETTIVTDSVTSDGLTKYITSLNGVHHRFKRGYKNVINESKRLNKTGVDSQLAIETSGHGALKENYFLDDGAYLICKILIKVALLHQQGQTINDLLMTLDHASLSQEKRFKIMHEDFKEKGQLLIEAITTHFEKQNYLLVAPNYEGVKFNIPGDGWFLARMSVHEPLLVVNYEGESESIMNSIFDQINQLNQ